MSYSLKEKYAALEALGYDCSTSGGEISAWRDPRPQPVSWEEIMAAAAEVIVPKAWPSVAEFYAEFSDSEQYLIQTSAAPSVVVARAQLAMWRGEVLADDPRIVGGMQALIDAGIISEARRDEILGS